MVGVASRRDSREWKRCALEGVPDVFTRHLLNKKALAQFMFQLHLNLNLLAGCPPSSPGSRASWRTKRESSHAMSEGGIYRILIYL